ncbi:MAG TPA: FkbM family methyltransferase [Candidatus Acidoferrum sp.]|jgi:FkbM family methyltransferase
MTAINSAIFSNPGISVPQIKHSVAITLTQFDQKHYLKLIAARGETIRRVIADLKPAMGLSTALDAGCGVGFFAQTLAECGLSVGGFDGRMENVVEARNRFPGIAFEQGDIENPNILEAGQADLVLCFGLLYHLENPMLAIRHLRSLTGKALLLESMCLPGSGPGMMLREEPSKEDQSLTEIALYPSEGCLVKMLYRAGFKAVCRVAAMPDHDDFRETPEHARRRTVLFASYEAVLLPGFEKLSEPRDERDPWARDAGAAPKGSITRRVGRFLASSRRLKYVTVANRARRIYPGMPLPLRLPFGAWWLAQKSALDQELTYGSFEGVETRFAEKVLRPGMTVLDVGAHHGLYTLLMSKRVGRSGAVIAFEPSARERRRLERHVRVNRCSNVQIRPWALGNESGVAELFMVEGSQDWCNSLRPPVVPEPTTKVAAEVRRLDDVMWTFGARQIDFLKLDIEGAELGFLHGAEETLKKFRPAMLVEVQDLRTNPWGYAAREIIHFMLRLNYRWFALAADSSLIPVSTELELYDANLVAVPNERVEEFQALLAE